MIGVILGILLFGTGVVLSCRYYFPFRPRISDVFPRVLLYHACDSSCPVEMPRRLNMLPRKLEAQFRWLKQNGYSFLFASELHSCSLPPKSVCITFDDGFEDNYIYLFPLLKKYGIKATIFVCSQSVFPIKTMLTDKQIKEMAQSGLVEFGGHTVHHINLLHSDRASVEKEIVDNKHRLETLTGLFVASFAYPFGKYTASDVDLLRRLGFQTAFTCERAIREIGNRLEIPRLYVNGKIRMFEFPLLMAKGKFKL